MTYFNEENTVEQLVLDTLTDKDSQWCVAEPQADYLDSRLTPPDVKSQMALCARRGTSAPALRRSGRVDGARCSHSPEP